MPVSGQSAFHPNKTLSPLLHADRAWNSEGQRWCLCEDVSHPLNRRLVVGRTTFQDGGLVPDTDSILSIAALKVAFNDSEVGAIIQLKAPGQSRPSCSARGAYDAIARYTR